MGGSAETILIGVLSKVLTDLVKDALGS
ncbi:hypothetical protein RHCRD62_10504 [Rhodococcus sp. RD6.2]|nr:hypothetical protein RHCRD62_10504 [Rhodococcus sp. RD6.2]